MSNSYWSENDFLIFTTPLQVKLAQLFNAPVISQLEGEEFEDLMHRFLQVGTGPGGVCLDPGLTAAVQLNTRVGTRWLVWTTSDVEETEGESDYKSTITLYNSKDVPKLCSQFVVARISFFDWEMFWGCS